MSGGESRTPQFATAEYPSNPSNMTCGGCRQPISGSYFKIKGTSFCTGCTEKIRAQVPRDSHAAFALVGLVLYVVFALATGLIIGYVSLAVGYIVGKAMRMGSGGVGGRRYQVAAVLLTYFAVSMSAVPIAIEQARHVTISGKVAAELALAGIASPILQLQDPVHGLIGLIILFVGMRFAWRFTAAPTLNVSGPHTAPTAGAT